MSGNPASFGYRTTSSTPSATTTSSTPSATTTPLSIKKRKAADEAPSSLAKKQKESSTTTTTTIYDPPLVTWKNTTDGTHTLMTPEDFRQNIESVEQQMRQNLQAKQLLQVTLDHNRTLQLFSQDTDSHVMKLYLMDKISVHMKEVRILKGLLKLVN